MESANSKEYSSLPLIYAITTAIVVSATGGWFALGAKTPDSNTETVSNTLIATSTTESTDDDSVDIDANLRKARMSAAADLLVAPRRRNALYFYGRVLSADPDHAVASAELDALLAAILLVVDDHLAADEFDDAYDLAMAASQHRPDHPLIENMQNDLNEFVTALADDASNLAQSGNDEEATARLATLKGLPGLSADYVAAAEQLVLETQQTRTEREFIEEEALREARAELEWQQKISDAIAAKNFITPEGESARDYLAERDEPAEIKEQLSTQLRDALLAAARAKVEADEFDDLESYLTAGLDFGADEDTIATLRADFEKKQLEQESTKSIALSEFVHLTLAPAEYPTHASRRDITGWVDVTFTVTKVGETADIEIVRAEPEKTFETSAIEAVKTWTFEPRQYKGQPIDQRTAVRLVFDME